MVEQRPVQTSAVYLVGATQFPAIPPPSPPSPVTPGPTGLCTPIEELSLDNAVDVDGEAKDVSGEFVQTLDDRLASAVHVLHTEATALQCLTRLYSTDRAARDGFNSAVVAITRHACDPPYHRGRLVVVGVGKSGHIGKKLAATFASLSVPATFLHPTEAMHGDLGAVGPRDTLLLVTASGRTPELMALLPHLDRTLPLIVLTAAAPAEVATRLPPDAIVLPAPVHEPEHVSFGVPAPTTSTTAALAVGDALALVVARELHNSSGRCDGVQARGLSMATLFARNHPAGAIGAAAASVCDRAVPWALIPTLDRTVTAADVLRAAYASPRGWVRVRGGGVASPCRIRRLTSPDLACAAVDVPGLLVDRGDFVCVAADSTVRRAAEWVAEITRSRTEGVTARNADDILGVLEAGECVGVLEAGTLLEEGL